MQIARGRQRKSSVGERHGFVTILAEAEDRKRPGGSYSRYVKAQCDCGKMFELALCRLRTGTTTHCPDPIHSKKRTHGACGTPTHDAWEGMHARCNARTGVCAHAYRDRGITVCELWSGPSGFTNFLADIGERPSGLTLDRIDNDRGYEPGNCRWTTRLTQMRNTRRSIWINLSGERLAFAEACRRAGVSRDTIRWKVRSTGRTYQAAFDHTLKRGGADAPSNLQWQTKVAAAAKDKWE
jgi:hypothetical protein